MLIDALRGIKTKPELMLLQERLTSNPANPPLFNWVCNLLIERRISRGLAARVLSQLHSDESANQVREPVEPYKTVFHAHQVQSITTG